MSLLAPADPEFFAASSPELVGACLAEMWRDRAVGARAFDFEEEVEGISCHGRCHVSAKPLSSKADVRGEGRCVVVLWVAGIDASDIPKDRPSRWGRETGDLWAEGGRVAGELMRASSDFQAMGGLLWRDAIEPAREALAASAGFRAFVERRVLAGETAEVQALGARGAVRI